MGCVDHQAIWPSLATFLITFTALVAGRAVRDSAIQNVDETLQLFIKSIVESNRVQTVAHLAIKELEKRILKQTLQDIFLVAVSVEQLERTVRTAD